MANYYYAIGNKEEGNIYEQKLKDCYDKEWELKIYNQSKKIFLEIIEDKKYRVQVQWN